MTESSYQDREQTEIKHYAIKLYLEAATRILGSRWNELKYVDCCAGPWESTAADYNDTSFGIALEVLRRARKDLSVQGRAPRMSCLLIEKETPVFRDLEAFVQTHTSEDVRLTARNWNFVERIEDIRNYCATKGNFPFILIDPWGWKLAGISQIAPLLQIKPGEVLINLMSSFITRFINDDATDLSDLLGEDFPELRQLKGSDLEFAIVRRYCDRVKKVGGYKYVCALPVMKPNSEAVNFHLIYATRHYKGVQVFKNVEKRTEEKTHVLRAAIQQQGRENKSGNLELFNASVLYRNERYQALATENRKRAEGAVMDLLRNTHRAKYVDCWAEALQFPAVYEADLRSWVSKWEVNGQVKVIGRKFPKEVLKVEGNHFLEFQPII